MPLAIFFNGALLGSKFLMCSFHTALLLMCVPITQLTEVSMPGLRT